jgi:16S rRNA (cytosine1402-N4)-methyltransferase
MSTPEQYHIPVLSQKVVELLCRNKNGVYVDATLGGGGHFRMLGKELASSAVLIGVDRDRDAIMWNRKHPVETEAAVIIEHSKFSDVKTILDRNGIEKIDGILMDLGISSFQIDNAQRGFSFMRQCDLDMRMNQENGITARELILQSTEEELAAILSNYGEVKNASRMAAVLKAVGPTLETSEDLQNSMTKEYGAPLRYKVLAKVFMALRIAVNDEFEELRTLLDDATSFLRAGGRIAVIAYHSLEDRIVKTFFREHEHHCICPKEALYCTCGVPGTLKRVIGKPVVASTDEIENNPRARSARLRVAEKTTGAVT